MSHLTITNDNFAESVTNAKQPVLLDFWAAWCGPCKMVEPIVDELATDYEGKVTVGKVNVDDYPELSSQFGVMSIPTLLLFKDGQPVETVIGVQPKPALSAMIDKHL